MRTKRILAVILTALTILATSTTALANERTIDFGGMEFTRTEFIEMFSDGAMLNGRMVSAEVFFDYFYTAQNQGRVYNTPPRNQNQNQTQQQANQATVTAPPTETTQQAAPSLPSANAATDEAAEDREVIPVLFEEVALLTNEELLSLIETAPLHQDTRSATQIPNRRITDVELETWIEEYAELGGINAFELEVVRLINEIRADYGLHPLAICPQISMAARFHSQELVNRGGRITHTSPHHGGSVARMRMFGNNQGLAENVHSATYTPDRAVQGWMHSPGHRALVLNASARTIGIGAVHSDEWNGAGRTTAKFGF